jgi:hypothetical protein
MNRLLRLLLALHYAYLRKIDLVVLWPSLKQEAAARGMGLDEARAVFYGHAHGDPPWRALGDAETRRRIERLT